MKNQSQAVSLDQVRQGRNTMLAIYVILTSFVITSYALIQYFSM